MQNEIMREYSATEGQISVPIPRLPDSGSFEREFARLGELDICNQYKKKAMDVHSSTEHGLGYDEGSLDCDLIKELNADPTLAKDILDFSSREDSSLSKTLGKKFAVEILKKIRSSSFRESDSGKLIYDEFLRFIQSVNVNQLEFHKAIVFDEKIITNTVLYTVLGIDFDQLSCFNDFSKSIYNLINCSQYDLSNSSIRTSIITDLGADTEERLREIADASNKSLDAAEKAQRSFYNRTLNFFGSFLSANAILKTAQKMVIFGLFAYGCNSFVLPLALDKGQKLLSGEAFGSTVTLDKIIDIKVTPQDSSDKEKSVGKYTGITLYQAIVNLIMAKAESYKK